MPLALDGGGDVVLVRNGATGRFDVQLDASGNPMFDDSETHTVLSLLLERQGGWWADPTGKRGSILHTIKLDRGSTINDLKSAVLDALKPAIDDGRIRNVTVDVQKRAAGNYKVLVGWLNRFGHVQNTQIPYGY